MNGKQPTEKIRQVELLTGHEVRVLQRNSDYCVSADGRVWSFKYTTVRPLKPHRTKSGVLRVELMHHGLREAVGVAVLVAETFLEGQGAIVYRDGNSNNCSVKNLYYGTRSERQRRFVAAGRLKPPFLQGEQRAHVRLTEQSVVEIRRRVKAGEKQNQLAIEFGVSANTISNIVRRRKWAHVP